MIERIIASYVIPTVLALLLFLLMNVIGKGLVGKYSIDYSDGAEVGIFNVGYRILAPSFFVCVFGLVAWDVFPSYERSNLIIVSIIYWALRIAIRLFFPGARKISVQMNLVQAAISIGLTFYLFSEYINDNPEMLIPEAKDFSFEFLLLASIVVLEFIARTPLLKQKSILDKQFSESKLYSLQRLCEPLLPERFTKDTALKYLFYSFAFYEDANRGKAFRSFERLGAKVGFRHFGLCNTTGIMQVKSNKILNDKESIVESIPLIENIWDDYLANSPKLCFSFNEDRTFGKREHRAVCFGEDRYSYIEKDMLDILRTDVRMLYAKYCGSTKNDINCVFNVVEKHFSEQCFTLGGTDKVVSVEYRVPALPRVYSKEGLSLFRLSTPGDYYVPGDRDNEIRFRPRKEMTSASVEVALWALTDIGNITLKLTNTLNTIYAIRPFVEKAQAKEIINKAGFDTIQQTYADDSREGGQGDSR